MSKKEDRRIIFYSKNDMWAWWHLEKVEKLLENINIDNKFLINDFLEFYNINKYFKNKLYLKKWNIEDIKKYTKISNELLQRTMLFFKDINDTNILTFINKVEFEYQSDFWELININKIYEKISTENFVKILYNENCNINEVLKYKNIIKIFDKEIRDYLLKYEDFYIILLNYMDSNKKDDKLYFPNSLSAWDIDNIEFYWI